MRYWKRHRRTQMSATPIIDRNSHPCFDPHKAGQHARIHLPVAPRCNMQCRYCNRSFDCVNESRPGVSAGLLTPEEALQRVNMVRERLPNLAVVGIAGPGDPLANPVETFKTFELVHQQHPDLLLCLSTNGLALPDHIEDIRRANISHLTVTVNAIRPETALKLYAWARYDGRAHVGREAVEYLWERQKAGLSALADLGLTVKVNTILVPGVNEAEAGLIAKEAKALGVNFMNIIPLIPVAGTALAEAGEPDAQSLAAAREEAQKWLPQLKHCKRCRSDAAGLLGQDIDLSETAAREAPSGKLSGCGACVARSFAGAAKDCSSCVDTPAKEEMPKPSSLPRVAIASREGLFINQHLGEAERLYIRSADESGSYLIEDIRALPAAGGGESRWAALADSISDCKILLVAGIGAPPKKILQERGITVYELEGLAGEALACIAAGEDLYAMRRLAVQRSCSGGAIHGCGCA
jgi:nitrogen fixation protein NifB